MRRLLFLLVLLSVIPAFGASQITGTIQNPDGTPVANGTITFTLSQPAVLSNASATLATNNVSCYTDASGTVVGLPNPLVPPIGSNAGGGSLTAGNTYFLKLTYVNASGETLPSSELAFVVGGGSSAILITAPTLQPPNATGYKIYASTTTGTETLQTTVTGFGNFTLTSIANGAALPNSNPTQCLIAGNDSMIPSFTYYSTNVLDSIGSQVSGFPQRYYLQGTPVNLSQLVPLASTMARFPQPIVSQPNANALQSINGPLSLGAFAFTAGTITASGNIFLGGGSPWYDIVSFGADPTGVTDSRAAIQAAINAANATCGTVFIPRGTFLLNSPQGTYGRLLKPLTCVSIRGMGPASVLKAGPNMRNGVGQGGFYMIAQTPDDIVASIPSTISNVVYSDFTIDQNGTNNLVAADHLPIDASVVIYAGDNITVERVTVQNNAGSQDIVVGCQILCTPQTAPTNVRIVNNEIHNTGTAVSGNTNQNDHSAIYTFAVAPLVKGNRIVNDVPGVGSAIENHSSAAIVVENFSTNVDHAYNVVATVNDQTGSVYANNTAQNSVSGGFTLWQRTGFLLQDITIIGNHVDVTSGNGTGIDANSQTTSTNTAPKRILIIGNTLVNKDGSIPAGAGAGMSLSGAFGGEYTVVDNTITDFFSAGMVVGSLTADATVFIAKGNTIRNCGRSSTAGLKNHMNLNAANRFRYVEIVGNTFSNPTLDTPATTAVVSNANILAGKVFNNTVENFTTELNLSGTLSAGFTFAPTTLRMPPGSLAAPSYSWANSTNTGWHSLSANNVTFGAAGVQQYFNSNGLHREISGRVFGWTSSATDVEGTQDDTTLCRNAAGVVGVGATADACGTGGSIRVASVIAGGAAAGLTGTGACATFSTQSGGSMAGRATCTAATAASTLTITPGTTAPTGWVCYVQDQTTRANLFQQTSNNQTTCTLTATSVTQNDVFVFTATAF